MTPFTRLFLFIIAISFSLPSAVSAQTTTVDGYVKDDATGEAIIFAHVFFKGTQTGTATDTTGYFHLQLSKPVDSIVVSYLGYHTQHVAIRQGERQTIEIRLQSEFIQLHEVEVVAGENPAWAILESVVDKKKENNPYNQPHFSCKEYSKIRFDLNHFTEKIKNNFLLRPFDFIWEHVDTTSDGVSYLPVLLVEKSIDHYYQRSPPDQRDKVEGINSTGLKGKNIMKFVEDLYLAPNIYDNFVVMLDKSFPSPINDNFKNHYNYVLQEDSIIIDDVAYYRIAFQPKYKRELAFTGEMLIHKQTLAIKKIELRFDILANVNFVRSYWVSQEYDRVDGKHWMPVTSQVLGDFTVLENSADMTGFFGRKNSTYFNYNLSEELPATVFRGSEIVVEADSAYQRDQTYWEANRKGELTKPEQGVFTMVDQLQHDPAFIKRAVIISAITTGYIPLGKIDVGDFYTFYSYNVIEDSRYKFGFRSNKRWDIPLDFSIYGAYGVYDAKWKYGVSADLNLDRKKKNRISIGFSSKYDIEQLGRSFNSIPIDHLFTSLVQIGRVASRIYIRDFQGYVDKVWSTGLITRFGYFNNTVQRTLGEKFNVIDDGIQYQQERFNATGVAFTMRYSWQNRDIIGAYYSRDEKKLTFRKYPDIAFEFRWADKQFDSDLNFQKVSLQLKQKVRLHKLGYFQYWVETGKTFGTVPYPYLNIPFGNQLVFQDDYAFNLMLFLEYVTDQFVNVHFQHHFDGLILDRIPLINKLKWRSLVFAKAYWGSLSDKNDQSRYLLPADTHTLKKGYYEVGFGIENIFKIARIDLTWRLTDTDHPNTYTFIVKPSFKLTF